MITELIFFISLFLLAQSYFLYPLIIYILAKGKKSFAGVSSDNAITILISAFNEEKVIKERIINISKLNLDFNKMQVIIGSDNSTDQTNVILESLATQYDWLEIIIFKERKGKAGVLNQLIRNAKNDILVFSDANTEFDSNSVNQMLKYFGSSNVGGVSGRLILRDSGEVLKKGIEEKRYWEFETIIKKAEGKLGILIGANGGIFAIRKELFTEIPTEKAVTDDLFLSLEVLRRGYEFKYENDAVAYENVGHSLVDEFKRKIRFAATNFQVLHYFKDLLFNKNIILSFAFWSHKVLRWITPVLLLVFLFFSALLFQKSIIYSVFFYFQLLFYLFALIGTILSVLQIRIKLFSYSMFFVMTNVAFALGFLKFIRGKHSVIWQSTQR